MNAHDSHCYQGEYPDTCKYMEENCPSIMKPRTPKHDDVLEELTNLLYVRQYIGTGYYGIDKARTDAAAILHQFDVKFKNGY